MAFDMTSLVTLPKMTRRERDAQRQKLAKDRAENIVGNLCALTRHALETGRILTPLAYEALFRRIIRSELCLQGWRWQAADDTARDLVAVVLSILQVKRPTWYEGQPEWTIREGMLIERTRCVKRHKPLPPETHKFCGHLCRRSHASRVQAMREGSEETVLRIATKSI